MDILQNPFHILGATSRDNRLKIMELAEERSLQVDTSGCMQARSDLTNPRKRLTAEVSWLPGIGPKRVEELLSLLNSSVSDILHVENLTPIAKGNMLAAGLSRLPEDKYAYDIFSEWILELANAFDQYEPERVRVLLNEERVVSGFPEITDILAIESELEERRRYYRKVILSALDKMPSEDLVLAVTIVVESATEYGEEHGSVLIDDLVDSYEVEAQTFLDKEEENIISLVEELRSAADSKAPDSTLAALVNKLIVVVKNWDIVAQPLQVSTKSRGLDHDASHNVASIVRSIALHLYNKHNKLKFSQQLTDMLQEVFAEVVEVAERTAEDAEALAGIAEQRGEMLEQVVQQDQEWRDSIYLDINLGTIFKKPFKLSHAGIEWKKTLTPLGNINRIRWGGTITRNQFGGISESNYSISYGDDNKLYSLRVKNENIYRQITNSLWRATGVRLLTSYLEGMREGNTYKFGDTEINDLGVFFECGKLFSKNEKIFCPWDQLRIFNEPGYFCIRQKDNSQEESYSYENEDNRHVFEAAIRAFWKRGGERLSVLLGE